jgi:hypothetical protein
MPSQEHARMHRRDQRLGGRTRPALPTWESLPLEDRHRLVRTIVQAARRQLEAGPASSNPRK